MTTDKHYFIEENSDGKFAVRAKGSQRASGLRNTQKQAEALVKKLNPNDKPNVERVAIPRAAAAINGVGTIEPLRARCRVLVVDDDPLVLKPPLRS